MTASLQSGRYSAALGAVLLVGLCLRAVGLDHQSFWIDEIASLAQSRSIRIRESELIGLAPAHALDTNIAAHVRLKDFDPARQIIERRREPEAARGQGLGRLPARPQPVGVAAVGDALPARNILS